jgi:hypothetical protein
MDIVARYLDAVKRYLPASAQADVVAELSDSIQSNIEERESELGRPLSLDEESAIVKSFGHPMIAASRYRSHQQLVGPALFPFYVNTLKIVLAIAVGVVAVAALTIWATTGDPMAAFARFWGTVWMTGFVVLGIVTAIFAAVERMQPKEDYTSKWDPRTLPPVDAERVPLACSITELIFNLFFVAFFLNLPGVRTLFETGFVGPVIGAHFALGKWWGIMLPTLIGASLVNALVNIINIARAEWWRLRAAGFVLIHAVLLVVSIFVLRMDDFVRVTGSVTQPAHYAAVASTLSGVVLVTLLCLAVLSVIKIVTNTRKLLARPPGLANVAHDAKAS